MSDQLLTFFHAHLALFAAFAAVLVLLVANELHGNIAGGRKLAPLDAVRLINDREPVVIDVRPATDFKKGHLINAMSLPLAKLEDRASEIGRDKSRPVIVYDSLGGAGVEAAARLRKLGFSEVYPLRGGLNGWLGANLPVTAR